MGLFLAVLKCWLERTAHETPCHSRAAERSLLKRLLKVLPLVVLPVLFGGFTEHQIEEARVTTHQSLERFRACLMKEGQIMLNQNDQKWSVEDASDYFKSACISGSERLCIDLRQPFIKRSNYSMLRNCFCDRHDCCCADGNRLIKGGELE